MITSDREQELTNDVSFTTYDGFLHKLFLLNNWLIRGIAKQRKEGSFRERKIFVRKEHFIIIDIDI